MLSIFHIDALSITMMALISFVALCVGSFSLRYLKGDKRYAQFFLLMSAMVVSVFLMVSVDHMLLFALAWATSNALLVRLIMHKTSWSAAKNSGYVALKNFALGFVFLIAALAILFSQTNTFSIQEIISTYDLSGNMALTIAPIFLAMAAMSQSALWPFHKWLISSVNAPTPVSALMHAGLVNGGAFLLARFSPLFFQSPNILTALFVIGIVTAFLGTLWKMMQPDIKGMLACSTMGQMGFMVVQCALGLFPAAIAHLCWHGLFKAYLFLSSGGAAKEKRLDMEYPPKLTNFALALMCGLLGAYIFSLVSHKDLLAGDTTFVLIFVAFIAASQFALSLLKKINIISFATSILATGFMGGIYGASVFVFNAIFEGLNLVQPQALNIFHILGMIILGASWLSILFVRPIASKAWIKILYVKMINASQPHKKTVTGQRNNYKYI